jgi:hypothetical protein
MKIKLSIASLLLTPVGAAWSATPSRLPFINDNFPQALTQAKQQKVPVFVEVWAPW